MTTNAPCRPRAARGRKTLRSTAAQQEFFTDSLHKNCNLCAFAATGAGPLEFQRSSDPAIQIIPLFMAVASMGCINPKRHSPPGLQSPLAGGPLAWLTFLMIHLCASGVDFMLVPPLRQSRQAPGGYQSSSMGSKGNQPLVHTLQPLTAPWQGSLCRRAPGSRASGNDGIWGPTVTVTLSCWRFVDPGPGLAVG